jgi:hypothetical protein
MPLYNNIKSIDFSTLVAGGAIELSTTETFSKYICTGDITATGNITITSEGGDMKGMEFIINFTNVVDITTNGVTLTMFGNNISFESCIGDAELKFVYNGTSWEYISNIEITPAVVVTDTLEHDSVTTQDSSFVGTTQDFAIPVSHTIVGTSGKYKIDVIVPVSLTSSEVDISIAINDNTIKSTVEHNQDGKSQMVLSHIYTLNTSDVIKVQQSLISGASATAIRVEMIIQKLN